MTANRIAAGAAEERGHYAARQAPPDLDASAPSLGAGDAQGLDRRALLLLAGIVLLLLLAIAALLRAVGGGADPVAQREEELVIPEPPRIAPAAAPADAGVPSPAPVSPRPAAVPLPVVPLPPPRAALVLPPPAAAPRPSLAERRAGLADAAPAGDPFMQAMLSGLPGATPPAAEAPPRPTARAATAARPLQQPGALLVRGTHIRCVLETRIVTDVPGQTACVVTEPVWSVDGRRLLLPAGSKALGSYEGAPRGPRVAVVWDRILTPDGIDIAMASPGMDGLGGAGHPGDHSAHWGSRIGSALLVSLIGDAFKYAAAEAGPSGTEIGEGGVVVRSPYESATARTLERLAGQALDVRRAPTVTIAQGAVVNIHVARDVDFSAVVAQP